MSEETITPTFEEEAIYDALHDLEKSLVKALRTLLRIVRAKGYDVVIMTIHIPNPDGSVKLEKWLALKDLRTNKIVAQKPLNV